MKNLYSKKDSAAFQRRHAWAGADLARRIYTSRLLGSDPRLVLHGGGNTSVKTLLRDGSGKKIPGLLIKGSGMDLATIDAAGMPALSLAPLAGLRGLKTLSNGQMIQALEGAAITRAAPVPSVETLLHAFLPHKFIDHTHANAVLALTDQADGRAICGHLFGPRVAIVPYFRPGFDLARSAARLYEANPEVEGLILLQHGIVTFGGTARESYGRMVNLVSMAEKFIKRGKKKVFAAARLPRRPIRVATLAPILRGLVGADIPMILDFRTDKGIRAFTDGRDLARYGQAGTATPDHLIRTKAKPLIVPFPKQGREDAFRKVAGRAMDRFTSQYQAYFERQDKRQGKGKIPLDPYPRVILVPGLGLFGAGGTAGAARIAADLARANIEIITDAERIGKFHTLSQKQVFDIEYWSLEQAKLGNRTPPPLAGRVAVITGGASGIGRASAQAFAAEGAEIAVLDRDAKGAQQVADEVGGFGLGLDVTQPRAVRAAFERIAAHYGGVDILLSNAGRAWQGEIGSVSDEVLRQSFELNFFAHQSVAQNAVGIMRAQGTGGVLLFNASKQAVNPGADFGPYGLPKAATLFLMRQYAVDHGGDGIRSNAVNADRIRSGLLTDSMIQARSKARALSEKDYMSGNLLGREVTAEDVAQAFVSLAKAEKTTGAVLTVDGGNIAAALR